MIQLTQTQTAQMADVLKNGGIAAFPTDTVYGVGCIFGNRDALARLKACKHRPEEKPVPVMCSDLSMLEGYAKVPESAQKLAEAFLPGALTLVMPLEADADTHWTNGKETVAVRIPDNDFILEVIRMLKTPLMVTSANISGMPAALTREEACGMLKDLDAAADGDCACLQASTIVDCTVEPVRILRPGPIGEDEIRKVLEK